MSAVFDAYADYYDLLYREKDYGAEARYVHSLLQRYGCSEGSALLDLGCGTGRHAQQLARLGFSVQGVDSSTAMVARARQALPAELRGRVRFENGDARSVRLSGHFDAVLALFHVASYQSSNEDLTAMFTNAAAHLNAGGLFIFDFWYGPGVLTVPPATRIRRLEDQDLRVTRLAEPTVWPNRNLVDVRYTVFGQRLPGGETFQFEETHRMRYLFLPELELMLGAAGMRVLTAERWLSGELDLTSWQGLIAAVKPDGARWEAAA
ncbi:MAG TPA: class I SAM-dependent methyltransferase [Steroidobacteraceae bacterium]|nr:class I SAM-dependent methyltransferase [Steroidobacteraceae bacterium]